MQSFNIQGFTYEQRKDLLPDLTAAFCNCGGWIMDRRTLSANNMEFRVELQLRTVLELYAAIVGTGVELTRSGHDSFTELCTRRKHLRGTADLGRIVGIRLEIVFIDDLTLRALLWSGGAVA